MINKLKIAIAAFLVSTVIVSLNNHVQAVTTHRIYGSDRYKTAVALSVQGWPSGSQYAVLTTGENYPDALSAAPLAKKYDSPILLTGRDYINPDTAAELRRLKVKQIFIVGGTGVISEGVENDIKSMISGLVITRLYGADRYDTAVKVAEKVGTKDGVVVATGDDFPDALSAAPFAAKSGMPIILVSTDYIAPSVTGFLKSQKISKSYIIGDNINETVLSNFQGIEKIGGYDKYGRNVNVLKAFSKYLDFAKIYICTGEDYPDALGAAVLAARTASPVILTNNNIPWETREFMMSNITDDIYIIGGNGALDSSVDNILKDTPAYIQSIDTVSISVLDKEKYDFPQTVTARVYSKLKGVTSVELPVTWNLSAVDTSNAGQLRYSGNVKGYGARAVFTVNIKPVPVSVDPITAEVVQYGEYSLPNTVVAKFSDGTTKDIGVTWSTNTLNLNKVGTIPIQGSIEGSTIKVSLTLKVIEEAEVKITDDTLRSILYSKLNKPSSRALYKSELLSITSLSPYGAGTISSLAGIENMTNLTYLDLSGYSISNISQLQNLVKLETLKLASNSITDVTQLQKLVKLNHLDLRYNKLKSISALKNLTRLQYLYLGGNFDNGVQLTDFSPVRQFYSNLVGKDFTYDGE